MLREGLAKNLHGAHNGVPWRSHEVSRIEALSDAVFAFAVTLLVVALEVPETFAELWIKMHGFLAFAISFAMLFQVWYSQHIFFRRYGLQDTFTVAVNGVLLFLVLFYMYPLKFLFALLASEFMGGGGIVHRANGHAEPMVASLEEARSMMIIYDLGFAAVFGIFVILYVHAWRLRAGLGLGEEEVFNARESIEANLIMVAVALASLAVLFLTGSPSLSGATFMSIGIGRTIHASLRGRQRRRRFGQ